jgi:hypothetical protein
MCDYSLMAIPNRLAAKGEQLVAHKFRSGTTGLVSQEEFKAWRAARPVRLWEKIKDCFSADAGPAPVVCIPPGARLRLENIPGCLRQQFGLDVSEEATFTQLSADENRHRDGLRFSSGATMLLQLLPEGQIVTVLRCSSAEDFEPTPEGLELSLPVSELAASQGLLQSTR